MALYQTWTEDITLVKAELRQSFFNVRLLHAFAFSKLLPWLAQASVITLETHQQAVNTR